jgi:CRISPR-associated endonuclease Cas2
MHLISYDISNDRLRLRAAKVLMEHGLYRIQMSVFMGSMRDSVLKRLEKELSKMAQSTEWGHTDSFLVLPLHEYSEENANIIGNFLHNWDELRGNLHTLVL